jgi:hypothetical protein
VSVFGPTADATPLSKLYRIQDSILKQPGLAEVR